MNYTIRPIRCDEYHLLEDFLYEAIFIPPGVEPPSRKIIKLPELQVYIEAFGNNRGDMGFLAEVDNKVVGAAWARIMKDYGHLDDDTPSCAISLFKEYRGYGIGTSLMNNLIASAKDAGYKRISLSVQKENYAFVMYKKIGFEVVAETDEEFLMVNKLN